jgi:multidrug efflux pump subunit AcrA (membrane-fusion protein)
MKEGKITSVQENRAKVLLRLADESDYLHEGIIDFEDNQLDAGTGTYRVRAEVSNADGFFSPGLFVRVRLPIGKPHRASLVSEQAIGTDQDGKFVFKLDDENKAVVQHVEVGRKHDGLVEIKQPEEERKKGKKTKGERQELKATDRIIVNGLQRIRLGDTVKEAKKDEDSEPHDSHNPDAKKPAKDK